ncbi:CheR family methyltransferase [Variovorax sp. ZT4R33]|uniref:CheR family methyltransferase n=1 Tax=Variovorax sp. ZT4R33 TaxID=3443743 RepID=UPI003F449C87
MQPDLAMPTDPEERPTLLKSSLTFPVMGIGASAGGLSALQRFLEAMPADNGMAFVVVLHLSPHHESNAAAILQRSTGMPVLQVLAPTPVEANRVYVIAPNCDLSMNDGWLRVAEPTRTRGPHVAIDLFFRALAQVHEERAVCAVFSGTGSDGAVGLKRVKEKGGLTLAQSPEDAEYDEMPRAAIATGQVDFVLPVAEMPQRLLDLWRNAQRIWLPAPPPDGDGESLPAEALGPLAMAEQALQAIMGQLRARTGHDFRHYKRATVLRRVERRLQVCGVPDLPSYSRHLQEHAEESAALLQDMLISVTNFFRDREAFEALEREVIPELMDARPTDDPVRAWVAGCATGEEAYSLSILLRERAERRGLTPGVQIFATDIDERALSIARAGLYPAAIAADVPPARLAQYFNRDGDDYRVAKGVREPVLFAAHNVMRDPPFSRLDLICCRNLLIYVGREAQTSILEMFRLALRPGGYLFLGSSESAELVTNLFTVVDKKHRIYRANPHANVVRHLPLAGAGPVPTGRPIVARQAAPRERSRSSVAELHARASERVAPPSVLVDAHMNILHLSEGAGRYLQQSGGVPTAELLQNVHPSLRLDLRTAMAKAAQSGGRAVVRDVAFERDGQRHYVHISAALVPSDDGPSPLTLVGFEEGEAPADSAALSGESVELRRIGHLENELSQLRDHLRHTIEQADLSTQELKASNEELQAMNEEMRSAAEELETSKEELQSMNEELITVNFELKTKVEETGKVNDDLQNFIVASDVATVFIDSGMRIKRFTLQATRIFNVINTDLERSLLDITHRLDYEDLSADIEQVFQQLRIVERSVRSIDERHYLARIRPYRTADDKIAGAVLSFVDVTELRRAEQRVVATEERLRLAALTTRDYAIITTDDGGCINTWNEGARRLFGYPEDEAVGQPIDLIFTAEDRASGAPAREIGTARAVGRVEDERWHRRKNGSIFFCSGVMTPIADASIGGFVKIARDVTDSKQKEAAREAMLQRERRDSSQARSAIELKDQFLAVMSHELKHPLNLIQVNAELLMRLPELRELPAVQRVAISIRGAVRSQAKIIDDLLDLSRARTGKLKLNREPVPLSVIEAVVASAEEDAASKNIALRWVCDAPGLVLPCDRVRTEQIVWNLVHNAIKFTPPGGRIVVTATRDEGFLRLSVADTGVGIAPDFLPKVFGMFNQAHGTPGSKDGGLGIGLALVQELSRAQGGRVLATSPGIGEGATFTVWLPVDGGVDRAAHGDASADVLQGLRILAVDDMTEALLPFASVLESEGAVVRTASSAADALELLAHERFDLLISDIGMPEMDGYQLMAKIRQSPPMARLPAIAVTGYGRAADVERALREGFQAHVPKPVDFEALKTVVAGLRLRATPHG